MKHKTINIRWSTWLRLRKTFPGEKGEGFAAYIDRLSKILEHRKIPIKYFEINEEEVKNGK